jgi:sigma-70-like protein
MAHDHGRVDRGFVVQEVFLRAWRAADGDDPRLSSLRTWLFAIAATSWWTSRGGSPSGRGSGR